MGDPGMLGVTVVLVVFILALFAGSYLWFRIWCAGIVRSPFETSFGFRYYSNADTDDDTDDTDDITLTSVADEINANESWFARHRRRSRHSDAPTVCGDDAPGSPVDGDTDANVTSTTIATTDSEDEDVFGADSV